MIRTVDIDINAANPNLPLAPFQAYVTSPSSVRIRNVPRKIGDWAITSVQLTVNYPDNTSRSAVCKLVAGVWVGTVVGSTATGTSTNGYAITASGTDENGYAVTGYILGKGDVVILATDGTITVGETTYYIHLLDAEPTTPHKGDLCKISGAWKLYNGSAWESFGGGDVSHSDFTSVNALDDRYTLADVKGKVNEVLNILKGAATMLLCACCFFSAFSALADLDVQTCVLSNLYSDASVVTNVTGSSGLTTNDVCAIVTNDVAATDWVTNITAISGGKEVKLLNVKWDDVEGTDQWLMNLRVPGIGDQWRASAAPNNTDPNATTLAAMEYPELVTTRTLGHNALGLAYERDIVPTVTGTVTKAYVEGLGIEAGVSAQTVTGIVASASVTNAGAVVAASAMTNGLQKAFVAGTGLQFTYEKVDPEAITYYAFRYDGQTVYTKAIDVYAQWIDVYANGKQSGMYEGYIFERPESGMWIRYVGTTETIGTATRYSAGDEIAATNLVLKNTLDISGKADASTVSALVTTTATHTATIAGWETYWTGDKVRLSVTNYYGNTSGELPRLRIEEFDHSTTTTVDNVQIVSNFYKTVWDEEARHTNYQAKVDAEIEQISTNVLTAAWQQTTVQLAGKAPRAWQDVTSAGEAAPENTVWMTAPNTVFAGGTEYAHVAVGEGTICVLVDNGAPVYTEGSDEGTFRFRDSTGGHYFGFDIRDHYELGCRTDSISVNNSTHLVSLTYDLTSSGNPYIMHSTNLVEWTDQTVTWEQNPPSGTKICYIDCGTDPKGFYKAEFRYAASSKFITNMAADFTGGILATNETGVGTSTQVKVYPVATTTGVVWRVEY